MYKVKNEARTAYVIMLEWVVTISWCYDGRLVAYMSGLFSVIMSVISQIVWIGLDWMTVCVESHVGSVLVRFGLYKRLPSPPIRD